MEGLLIGRPVNRLVLEEVILIIVCYILLRDFLKCLTGTFLYQVCKRQREMVHFPNAFCILALLSLDFSPVCMINTLETDGWKGQLCRGVLIFDEIC